MTDSPKTASYAPEFYEALIPVEERHFWFRARNNVIASAVRQIRDRFDAGFHCLEIGCGTGNVLRMLEKECPRGSVVGVDFYRQGLRAAQQRTAAPLVQADVNHLPVGHSVEVIGLFDVLEHLPDDSDILQRLYAKLRPGGILLLTVPAHAHLWSYFDEASHHVRRYSYAGFKRKLEQTGFQVEYLTEYMCLIYPLVWAGRMLASWLDRWRGERSSSAQKKAETDLTVIPLLNALVELSLSWEPLFVARRWRIPFGTSLLAVARKDAVDDLITHHFS